MAWEGRQGIVEKRLVGDPPFKNVYGVKLPGVDSVSQAGGYESGVNA